MAGPPRIGRSGEDGLLSAALVALDLAERLDDVRDGHGLLGYALGVGAAPAPRPGFESDAVHLASRLRESAPPGAILLGGLSWPELSDRLVLKRAPELAPLLSDGPVPAFLLEGSTGGPGTKRASDPSISRTPRLKSV